MPSCPVPTQLSAMTSAIRGGRGVTGHPVTSLTTRRELPRPGTSIGFSSSNMCLVGGTAALPLNALPTAGNSLDRRGVDGSYVLHRAQPTKHSVHNLMSSSSRSHLHQIGLSTGIVPPHDQISDSDDEEDWC